jgi:hypothetical protein
MQSLVITEKTEISMEATNETGTPTLATYRADGSSEVAPTDEELIQQAEAEVDTERYFRAAKLLQAVQNQGLLQPQHHRLLELAVSTQAIKDDLLLPHPEDGGWKKQSETHGHRDTSIYYKVNKNASMLCRIETPIEESLLLPIISVFNESELFESWMPRWKVPRLGISKSDKLRETGRGNQVIRVGIDMPFPFRNRECVQHAVAIDSIGEDQTIVVKVDSLDEGTYDGGLEIGPAPKGTTRVDFHAGILFRSYPDNHPLMEKSKHDYPAGERLILLSVSQSMDAHVAGVPMSIINFFTRTVLGGMWGSLMKVAEEVRDGQRPLHQQAIQDKQELYGWLKDRVEVMLSNMGNGGEVKMTDSALLRD